MLTITLIQKHHNRTIIGDANPTHPLFTARLWLKWRGRVGETSTSMLSPFTSKLSAVTSCSGPKTAEVLLSCSLLESVKCHSISFCMWPNFHNIMGLHRSYWTIQCHKSDLCSKRLFVRNRNGTKNTSECAILRGRVKKSIWEGARSQPPFCPGGILSCIHFLVTTLRTAVKLSFNNILNLPSRPVQVVEVSDLLHVCSVTYCIHSFHHRRWSAQSHQSTEWSAPYSNTKVRGRSRQPFSFPVHCAPYFCDTFVKFHLILLIFWQKKTPGNLKQTPMHSPPHLVLSLYVHTAHIFAKN